MSPIQQNLDTVSTESCPSLSDMRRMSLALAFSPARHRRRDKMNAINGWLRSKLGLNFRRQARAKQGAVGSVAARAVNDGAAGELPRIGSQLV